MDAVYKVLQMLFVVGLLFILIIGLGSVLVLYLKTKIAIKVADKYVTKSTRNALSNLLLELVSNKHGSGKIKSQPKRSRTYRATLKPARLMNRSEEVVFGEIKKLLTDYQVVAHIFPQVSYGEIAWTDGPDAFALRQTFNSKRADFVVTNADFFPIAVIEYHGEGHFSGVSMAKSDRVKSKVCQAIGVPLIIVHFKDKHRIYEFLRESLLPVIPSAEAIEKCFTALD